MDKIILRLSVVDDYPPAATEGVWAERQPSGFYRIANIPFYSQDVCLDDEVEVRVEADGLKWFQQVGISSGNSTLRLVFMTSEDQRVPEVLERINALGCSWEGFSSRFYSVNVPATVLLDSVLEYLQERFEQGWLDYESGLLRQ
ncbi:DUF4265 domain-containing protein [Pseudomonas sp. Fl5BN2]|uniref:DUF4265 domain-containing protein n=1 Tax=unclassified Pseudomonas TaxID=196821 RepID=UPI0013788FC1|nr:MULTISPECIES: DUF4265 domain-containing protein [unclassified Pseudomonas]NBF04921.1 DUF4265 domain-containing protein [Pseudomonas sp. Fl5BN2]NBF09167.1 DUF4265 domain-containing protein [Pseudomonas sp. Fl4BN1]